MNTHKKYRLYKIEISEGKQNLFDVFFYIKLIAIVLFAVIDSLLDLFHLSARAVKTLITGDWFEEAIKRYLIYARKMKNLYSDKNRQINRFNEEIKKFQSELLNNKERRLIFKTLKKGNRYSTKKHVTC